MRDGYEGREIEVSGWIRPEQYSLEFLISCAWVQLQTCRHCKVFVINGQGICMMDRKARTGLDSFFSPSLGDGILIDGC